MACAKPDGTLSTSGRSVLEAAVMPGSAKELVGRAGFPLFRVRSGLRDAVAAELIGEQDCEYVTTAKWLSLIGERAP